MPEYNTDSACPCGGMADTVDLKSTAARRAGSSPARGTFEKCCTHYSSPEVRTIFSGFDSSSGVHGRKSEGTEDKKLWGTRAQEPPAFGPMVEWQTRCTQNALPKGIPVRVRVGLLLYDVTGFLIMNEF